MGNIPGEPGTDEHLAASWADTPVQVLLDQADAVLAGGDAPRAEAIIVGLLQRGDITESQEIAALTTRLRVGCARGDVSMIEAAIDRLAGRGSRQVLRQEIRMGRAATRYATDTENALLRRLEESEAARSAVVQDDAAGGILSASVYARGGRASRGETTGVAGESAPDGTVDSPGTPVPMEQLLDLLRSEDVEEDGSDEIPLIPGTVPDGYRPGAHGTQQMDDPFAAPVYEAAELRSALSEDEIQSLTSAGDLDSGVDPLPLIDFGQERGPASIHRLVADHPGVTGRALLRRFAVVQAARHSPADLQHSYDVGLDLFGAEAYAEAVTLLVPAASIPNPERLGALELLTRALFELDRLVEAEPYLLEAIPNVGGVTDPAYSVLLFWLGKIAEEKGDPGQAIGCYSAATRLDPSMEEPKRRLRVLLGL